MEGRGTAEPGRPGRLRVHREPNANRPRLVMDRQPLSYRRWCLSSAPPPASSAGSSARRGWRQAPRSLDRGGFEQIAHDPRTIGRALTERPPDPSAVIVDARALQSTVAFVDQVYTAG